MIKKRQKWIALFVTLTFMWLLQVSTMPLAAAGTTEQVSSASAEQEPGSLEAVSYKAAPAKKKSIVPIILIGVGVAAVAAILILVVFKTKYDIVGTWDLTTSWSGGSGGTVTNEFVGDKETGDVNLVLSGSSAKWGEYTVDGKDVTFWILTSTFTGKFTDKTHMSGTMAGTGSSTGTWTAVKTSDTTIAPIPTNSIDRQTAERLVTNK
jgi:hypothetical protein